MTTESDRKKRTALPASPRTAGAQTHANEITSAFRLYPDAVKTTLNTLGRLNPDFVNQTIQALMIRDSFRDISRTAIDRTKEILEASLV
jgi:hypothetical protein